MADEIGHIHDEDLGDVMTLGQMYETADAVDFLHDELHIPNMTARILANARRRGEIPATVFGRSVVYAERDLLAWVAGRYGKSHEQVAVKAESVRATKKAQRSGR